MIRQKDGVMAEIFIQIEEHLLVLVRKWQGLDQKKEIEHRVSFNGAPAKYDIRTWRSRPYKKMGKGITLTNEEFQVMLNAFKN